MPEVLARRGFRVSIRALMIAVALFALFFTPIVFMYRRNVALVQAERMAADSARLAAERAMYAAQLQAAKASLKGANIGNVNQGKSGTEAEDQQGNLWAAVSVNRALFRQGETKDLRIVLTLVNDGDQVIDPKIAESRIMINGKELADSGSIFGNAPKDSRFTALPPGDQLEFSFAPGEKLSEPGIHLVSWKGADFQSPEVVVRIIAEKIK
jgi:hypothetical protein